MKTIYFVTEGTTDQIVLAGLVAKWMGETDFVTRYIQPPSSAYAEDLDTNLSTGWKGVLAWCSGMRSAGAAGRDEALNRADCLIVHTDADVAFDTDFKTPAYSGPCPPAQGACDWVRSHLISFFSGNLPANVVICVPSQDLEAWVLCALHPELADKYIPIECRLEPGTLLVQLPPHRLVRGKGDSLKKETGRYRQALQKIVNGWSHCTKGDQPRCPEAYRFEKDARGVLGV